MRKYCVKPLPHWCLTDLQPAFYDTESGSVIQLVARIYPKIEELVVNYNSFVDEINRYVDEFERGIIKDFECFKACITKTINEYIETIDTKISLQDSRIGEAIERQDLSIANKFAEQDAVIANKFAEQDAVIADAVQYMKDNIVATATTLFQQALANGTIVAELHVDYDAQTEALTLSINANNGGE